MSAYAPLLADLALLALVLGLALGLTLALLAALTGRAAFAGRAALGTLAFAGLYVLALTAVALASREVVLAPGAEKSVAGFDPHLHFAVAAPAARAGDEVLVVVRLRSDARRALQDPSALRADLIDADGRAWPARACTVDTPERGGPAPALARRLEPGAACVARLRFRPGPGARGLRLWMREAGLANTFLIGHESSPFHRRTLQAVAGL